MDVAVRPGSCSTLVAGLNRGACSVSVADKGYDSDALRALLVEHDIFLSLGVSRKRDERRYFHEVSNRRLRTENFFARLKRNRRFSIRYDKLASSFLTFVTMSSILYRIQ